MARQRGKHNKIPWQEVNPKLSRETSLGGAWWCPQSHTKDGDMVKRPMAEDSRALHLLLVGGSLGFTSNTTGQDSASSQMDAEMHDDDLTF